MNENLKYKGNRELLHNHKTAFLCSRKCPANIILKSYDWAIDKRKKGECVISGFHSKIERDVFHYLLKGEQPVILVLARGMQTRNGPDIKKALVENRLLIISPFEDDVKRVTQDTADIRNRVMTDIADEIFIAHASKGGNLEKLILDIKHMGKSITSFNDVGCCQM